MTTRQFLCRIHVAVRHWMTGDRAAATDALYALVVALREDVPREPDAVSRAWVQRMMREDDGDWRQDG